jgi:hypothetical protein
MNRLLAVHSNINDRFHGSSAGPSHFFRNENAGPYAAYYTSMYLIQDTGEAILSHMGRGFSSDPLTAYIEFWGVMQAIFIQQDAICELYEAVVGSQPRPTKVSNWSTIREVRNVCAGHPAKRDRGVPATQRTFMGRNFGTYERIQYELWDSEIQQPSHPTFNLEAMINAYEADAVVLLNDALSTMSTKWP